MIAHIQPIMRAQSRMLAEAQHCFCQLQDRDSSSMIMTCVSSQKRHCDACHLLEAQCAQLVFEVMYCRNFVYVWLLLLCSLILSVQRPAETCYVASVYANFRPFLVVIAVSIDPYLILAFRD